MPEVVKQGFLTAVVIPELQLVPLALRQGRDGVVHYGKAAARDCFEYRSRRGGLR